MSRCWLILTRLCVLAALGASAALYAYYMDPLDSEFCAAHSGCETLRRSPLAYFGSQYISLPLFGMLAFSAAFAVSLWAQRQTSPQRYAPLFWMLSAGAVIAAGLMGYQAWVAHAFCWLCMLTDGAALLAASAAFLLHRAVASGSETQKPWLTPWAWIALGVLTAAAPVLWNGVRPLPPIPRQIRALYQPGKINVVEFADLECPHCRKLQPLLKTVMATYPGKVHFVRKHAPLPQHPHAQKAATAVICAEQLAPGRGEEMVDRLVSVELSSETLLPAATALGLDEQTFSSCLERPSTLALIEEDLALLREVGFDGLPTTYVGAQRFIGVRNEEAWRDAFDSAERGEGHTGIPGSLYLLGMLLLGAGLVFKGRVRA